jgi:hypothetical protein
MFLAREPLIDLASRVVGEKKKTRKARRTKTAQDQTETAQ